MAITAAEAIAAVDGTRGNATKLADKLGVSRVQVWRLRKKWPTLHEAILEEKDKFKDLMETTIEDQCLDGNTTMLIFYAKTQMRDRGYIERHEVDHQGLEVLADWLKELRSG